MTLVMEYCKGSDLFDYLQVRDFDIPEKRAAQLISQIILALNFLHSFGILHRDLKLENILMTNDSELASIKILDFGLSKILGPKETCMEMLGTIVSVVLFILIVLCSS